MRKTLLFTMFSAAAIDVAAQDIIIMRNGDEVEAKVTKVSSNEVEYHKWSNLEGPVYSVDKADVFMVKYKNGEKDVFDNVKAKKDDARKTESDSSTPQYVEAVPAANNQELISLYNKEVKIQTGKQNGKDADHCFPILGVASTSIMATDEVEVRIVTLTVEVTEPGYPESVEGRYALEITNKTNKLLYIDLANSFRIEPNGKSKSYYNSESTTVTNSSSSGAGLNLGAVTGALGVGGAIGTLASGTTVGGSSQGGVSTTYTNNRILTIAPNSKQYLTEFKKVKIKREYKILSDLEEYKGFDYKKRGFIKKNEIISYTEKDSPFTTKHLINYSTEPDFKTYSTLQANLYIRKIIGNTCYYYGRNTKSILEDIREILPDFSFDSNIIIGRTHFISKQ
ncbi:MAG: hypothetical protein PUE03_01150 [Prevotella sp.]|nr:hypothetical protein [Prevotella sp.]